jgi:hypothetical protein
MSTNLLDLVGNQDRLPALHYIKSANCHLLTWGPESPQIYLHDLTGPLQVQHLRWLNMYKALKHQSRFCETESDVKETLDEWLTLCQGTPLIKSWGGGYNDTQYVAYIVDLTSWTRSGKGPY